MEYTDKIIFLNDKINPIIKKFIDKLLKINEFKKLKYKIENEFNKENINNFLIFLSKNIKKLLLKLNDINEYEFNFELIFLNDNHYPLIKIKFSKFYNSKIINIIENLNNNDILEFINNYKNKKYLKFNNNIKKKLDYCLKNKITDWNKIILFNRNFMYRYISQITSIFNNKNVKIELIIYY